MYDLSAAFQDELHQPFTLQGTSQTCAILVHGFPGTPREMRSIADVLHAFGWTVHGLLLPGFGREINSLAEKSYTDWLSAVLNAINHYRKTHENIVLVGHSMGGAISIQASVSTAIDALLVLAPFWKVDHILWSMLPAIRLILPSFKPFKLFPPDFKDPDFRANLSEWLPTTNIDDPNVQAQVTDFAIPTNMINQVRIAGIQARQSVPHIKVPTTVIQGRQDELVKQEITQMLVQIMTTNVNYQVIDGDHNLTDIQKPHWNSVKALIHQFAVQFEHNLI